MENKISNNQRREFLKKSLGISGIILCAGSLSTLLDSCSNSSNPASGGTGTVDISTVSQLATDGGVVEKSFTGQFNDYPVIIIRVTASTYLAFSTVCPHQGNQVNYPSNSTSDIICPAHDSHFSPKTGNRISGPAPTGLTKYSCSYNSTTHILTITG